MPIEIRMYLKNSGVEVHIAMLKAGKTYALVDQQKNRKIEVEARRPNGSGFTVSVSPPDSVYDSSSPVTIQKRIYYF